MKKALILGLMALTATFASAVSVSWSNTTTSGDINRSNFEASRTFTFCLGSASNIMTGDTLSSIAMVMSDTSTGAGVIANYVKVSDSQGNFYISKVVANKTDANAIIDKNGNPQSRTVLTYVFDSGLTLDTSLTYTMQFYSDAECKTGAETAFALTKEMSDVVSNTKYTNYEVLMTINAEHASVPEPTVLALLALGVAGLALKRRV